MLARIFAAWRRKPWRPTWRRLIDDIATLGGIVGLLLLLDAWFEILMVSSWL